MGSFKPRPLYPRGNSTRYRRLLGVVLRAVLDAVKLRTFSCPSGKSNPGRPALNPSLYPLSYPGSFLIFIGLFNDAFNVYTLLRRIVGDWWMMNWNGFGRSDRSLTKVVTAFLLGGAENNHVSGVQYEVETKLFPKLSTAIRNCWVGTLRGTGVIWHGVVPAVTAWDRADLYRIKQGQLSLLRGNCLRVA
jgi:hypothetical protein